MACLVAAHLFVCTFLTEVLSQKYLIFECIFLNMQTPCFFSKSALCHKDIIHHIIILATHSLPLTCICKSKEFTCNPVPILSQTFQPSTLSLVLSFANVGILTPMHYLPILKSSQILTKNVKVSYQYTTYQMNSSTITVDK